MSPKVGPTGRGTSTHLWMLLWPLLCAPALAEGTAPSTVDPQSAGGATSLPEDWTITTLQLQPDLQTEAMTLTEAQAEGRTGPTTEALTETQTRGITSNYTGLSCIPVLPPRRGSFYVESGTGVSVGSTLAFWCREGYQLVGSDKIYCFVRNGKPQWSNYLPVCEAIPRPEDRGLRVAVLASVVSGIVILAMSLSFLICCLQERSSRKRAKREGRSRRREKHSARHSECWLEREEGEWEAFPPPKIFHLSQRMNPRMAPDSPLYLTGALGGYENRGYQRSQESLLKASLPGLYRSESQLYPHVVLQRVPTPTAPSAPSAPSAPIYLHLPTSSSSAASTPAHAVANSQAHIMAQYPTPTYPPNPNTAVPAYPHPAPAPIYPNPNPVPQRPWQ
ncbi:putative sushi domain-containing protein 3-like [Scophthalmus maximus]|uniref:Putative sushi domain-containing protein 3-like n=1 Tax=Scophthalmus maximus TaxID=52904 RepID=A0A2U9B1F7_SCOMX|nr:putative sushi domain-containing protein 3-like [Scophthalmus maximus]